MISIPDTATLLPQKFQLPTGHTLYLLPSESTDLVRLDFIHEAGSAYQPQPLCAAAANRLFSVAAEGMDDREVAEFMDYRGIIVEHNPDILTATTSVYFLRRYFDELMPVLRQLLERPAFPQEHFYTFCRRRKQELLAARLKSGEVARRLFYQTLFGTSHPLGRYATPDAADRLDRDTVVRFYHERYSAMDIVLSGNIDPSAIEKLSELSRPSRISSIPSISNPPVTQSPGHLVTKSVPGAVQTSLRIGRVLPLRWDDPDYACFMLLTTLLGGYFGSRLMSNVREDKGYTYGIYARTQIYRGVIVFYITADVSAGSADAAETEIRHELQRLCDQPVGDDELALVKNVFAGDFIRSVDGVFERAERLCSMLSTAVDETLTDNLRQMLYDADPDRLQAVARRLLQPDTMVYCRAGVV